MNKKLIIFNLLPIIVFILLFKNGANVTLYMLPVWLIMSIINTVFAKSAKDVLKYNTCLALSAMLGVVLDGILYFIFVYYDSVGEQVVYFELVFVAVFIAVLTVLECLIKRFLIKRKNAKEENTENDTDIPEGIEL